MCLVFLRIWLISCLFRPLVATKRAGKEVPKPEPLANLEATGHLALVEGSAEAAGASVAGPLVLGAGPVASEGTGKPTLWLPDLEPPKCLGPSPEVLVYVALLVLRQG